MDAALVLRGDSTRCAPGRPGGRRRRGDHHDSGHPATGHAWPHRDYIYRDDLCLERVLLRRQPHRDQSGDRADVHDRLRDVRRAVLGEARRGRHDGHAAGRDRWLGRAASAGARAVLGCSQISRMATVHDVARRAGVSASTVSHVVNNTRFVSDELRERVLAAMRELDYTPNAAARMLTLKRSHTIGLIVSDIRNPFFASVARGVEDVAQELGYTLVLCNSDENAERETACLNALETRAIDGVLLASAGVASEHLSRLVRAGFPIVLVDRDLPELGAPAILLDNDGAAYGAVKHLIAAGHRRIAMISGRASISTTTERVAGYRRALREAHIRL